MIFAKSHVLSAVAVAILTLTGIQGGQADAQLLRSSISIGSYGYGLGGYGYRSYYGGSGLLRSRTSISYRSHIRYPRYGYSAYGYRSGFGIGLGYSSYPTGFYRPSNYYSNLYRPYYATNLYRPFYTNYSLYAPRYAFYTSAYPAYGARSYSVYRSAYFPTAVSYYSSGYAPRSFYYSSSAYYRPVYVYPSYSYVPQYPVVRTVAAYRPTYTYRSTVVPTTIYPTYTIGGSFNYFHTTPYTVGYYRPYYTYCQPTYPTSPLAMCPSCIVPGGNAPATTAPMVTPQPSTTLPSTTLPSTTVNPPPVSPQPEPETAPAGSTETDTIPKSDPEPPKPGDDVNTTSGPTLAAPVAN